MNRQQVKFVVVGSVDHGKSTLIGRFLYDTHSIPQAQLDLIETLSQPDGGGIDFAFVLDHLQEERRRHITIDTTQTYFSDSTRDYVIIDAPGHKEFLQNMLTGASQASAAMLMLDAHEGLTAQTRRHSFLLSLLGIAQVIVVINKMDLVGYSHQAFRDLTGRIGNILLGLNIRPLATIPAAALTGENIVRRSSSMPWYSGPTAIEALALLTPSQWKIDGPLRLPVQDVYTRAGRAVAVGRCVSGTIHAGQQVVIYPQQEPAEVEGLLKLEGPLPAASARESIGLTLSGGQALRRGQVIASAEEPPTVSQTLKARVFWMSKEPLALGENFSLRLVTQDIPCRAERILERYDAGTLTRLEADAAQLAQTEVAVVELQAASPVLSDHFASIPEMGRLVLTSQGDILAGGIVV